MVRDVYATASLIDDHARGSQAGSKTNSVAAKR